MAEKSRFKVSMQDLEKVHVPIEQQITETDVTAPVPDAKAEEERLREATLRVGAPGI